MAEIEETKNTEIVQNPVEKNDAKTYKFEGMTNEEAKVVFDDFDEDGSGAISF